MAKTEMFTLEAREEVANLLLTCASDMLHHADHMAESGAIFGPAYELHAAIAERLREIAYAEASSLLSHPGDEILPASYVEAERTMGHSVVTMLSQAETEWLIQHRQENS